jgi:NADPH2:quinone reductase
LYVSAVRAARITELGRPPEPAEIDAPSGGTIVEMEAVSLNPLDVSIGAGRFYGGHPDLPYVPGSEGVGRADGELVYVFGGGLGLQRDGTLAERVEVPEGASFELPEGVDPALASACGIAGIAGWTPVVDVAQVGRDDRVLVLGATGTVGSVALQASKLRGAARVVAAGRDRERLERARELGADEVVVLGEGDMTEAFKAAFDGEGPSVVIDPLWGDVVCAATEAAAPGARIIHIGQSAGPQAPINSAALRGKQLTIQGHSNFGMTPWDRRAAHLELLEEVQAGRITIDVERFPLDRVADAWAAQAAGRKAIVELA